MRYNVSKFLMYFILLLLMLFQPLQAVAGEKIAAADNSACMVATAKFEKQYQIKEHLLTTISNVETGRWNSDRQQSVAWPWTVNAQGKGNFYSTKAEAVRAVRQLQAQGVKSIDVGCMQINLVYHPDAFDNLEAAFDPHTNVEYGAQYLKNLYNSRGNDWIKAAMAYHSSVPAKAQLYKKKLFSTYEQVKQASANSKLDVVKTAATVKATIPQAKTVVAIEVPEAKPYALNESAKELKTAARIRKFSPNPAREARLIADATSWREAKLAEYRERKNNNP